MKDVNELMRAAQQNQRANKEIQLSSVMQQNDELQIDPSSSLEDMNGSAIPVPPEPINPMRNMRPVMGRATMERNTRRVIDPADVLPPPQPKEQGPNPRDKAFNILEQGINRKIDEFREGVSEMMEKSDARRELVENGLEEVKGELKYRSEDLNPANKEAHVAEFTEDDMIENDLLEGSTSYEEPAPNYKIASSIVGSYSDESIPTSGIKIDMPEPAEDEEFISGYVYAEEEYPNEVAPLPDDYKGIEMPGDNPDRWGSGKIDYEFQKEVEPEKEELQPNADDMLKDMMNNSKQVKSLINTEKIEDPNSMNIDPADFSDLDDAAEEDARIDAEQLEAMTKAGLNNLRTEILNKIVNTGKKVDVAALKMSTKAIPFNKALQFAEKRKAEAVKKTATWPLMTAGRPYVTTPLSGPEVVLLNTYDDGQNSSFLANERQLRILYNHDANPYKPQTFEAWAKTIPYTDIEEMFAAVYSACFDDANYMPLTCDKCKHSWLSEHMPMSKLTKFKNDAAKAKFDKIMAMPLTAESSLAIESVVVPINEYYAIGFKVPSIYNMLLELRSVNVEFIDKYAAIVTVIMYIDKIYMISDEGELAAISWKEYPGDVTKTFKSKIAAYSKILNSLDSNEFSMLTAYINSLSKNEDDVTYVIPSATCPKCGESVPERDYTAKSAVFTRARLVDLASTSIE